MPRPTFVNCAFDPDCCPLLEGLSPEERRIRMAEDPVICGCIARNAKSDKHLCSEPELKQKPAEAPKVRLRRRVALV
jgi:hypothetical protein